MYPTIVIYPGGDFAFRGQPDGAVAVAKGPGSRQLLHPLPHSSGRPVGDRLLGSELQTDSYGQFFRDWSLTDVVLDTVNVLLSICKWLKHTVKFMGFKKESRDKATQEVSIMLYFVRQYCACNGTEKKNSESTYIFILERNYHANNNYI